MKCGSGRCLFLNTMLPGHPSQFPLWFQGITAYQLYWWTLWWISHTDSHTVTWPHYMLLLAMAATCHLWACSASVFNPRPLRPKGYCRHLRLFVCLSVRPSVRLSVRPSVCLSVPIILVNTITQSVYPISPPNLLGGFNMALPWMVL